MAISVDNIKELREMTSCGVIECKKALEEAGGDFNKAKEVLQKRGLEMAAKKGSRLAKEGRVEAYVHLGNKIGVLLEVNCETDFVAKNDDFREFAKNIAMHITATNPVGITPEDVPEETVNREKAIYRAQALETGKPENIIDKIAEGKLQKFYKDNCLIHQPYIKDPNVIISDLLNSLIAKIGENITIKRFVRFQVGES